ncbi:1,4-dihydroxy-2-naphthoate polyprenyltransferase [Reichenbachiella versicolor]|uniref:1,4-dihydroxy-2-naphthoate polyprenyltransferase n=1 Tax=Reichenbachiella versicolor TaxID=1821036 RepID=UPI000D6E67CF|nr:1,4-dihydroxy-2-naphthoate polyprenyltransferase [Reichenbachiella versicolor]
MKKWIQAFRLRTLPLSLSCILMGNFLAAWVGRFDCWVGSLTILTTVFLQILSNLANDYGDSIHGADSDHREGPSRAVQTGSITLVQMRKAIYLFAGLSLLSGILLIWIVFQDQIVIALSFLALGLMAIYAAITYTAGNNPYGYVGLGDISVFIFFGLVGVVGSYYMQTKSFNSIILLPAISSGFLATGVLNVNNIRDIESDIKAGKRSIPVRIGRKAAVAYHTILIIGAIITALLFTGLTFTSWAQFLFLLITPLLLKNVVAVRSKTNAMELDPYLKQLAISTLLFVLLFGLGLNLT